MKARRDRQIAHKKFFHQHVALLLLALYFILLALSTRASIHVRSAAYVGVWRDVTVSDQDRHISLKRYYSSRLHHTGLFGYGWCTDFEKSVTYINNSEVILNDCLLSQPLRLTYSITENQLALVHYNYQNLSFNTRGELVKVSNSQASNWIIRRLKDQSFWLESEDKHLQIHFIRKINTPFIESVSTYKSQQLMDTIFYEYENDKLRSVRQNDREVQNLKYDIMSNLTHVKTYIREMLIHLFSSDEQILERKDLQLPFSENVSYETETDQIRSYANSEKCFAELKINKETKSNRLEFNCENKNNHQKKNDSSKPREPAQINNRSDLKKAKAPIVAIIDTGIDMKNEKLVKSLWQNTQESRSPNSIDSDQNGYIDDQHGFSFVDGTNNIQDYHGHGTHIAGIIHSLNPDAQLMILNYYDTKNPSRNVPNTVRAIEYAVKMGAHIINYSGGGPQPEPLELQALKNAEALGILVIAASGNHGQNNDRHGFYPASYAYRYGLKNIISVGSASLSGRLLSSSNFGPRSVDFVAFGEKIESYLPGSKRGVMTGTSQAAAYTTGLASLALQHLHIRDADLMKKHLLNTGDWLENLHGRTLSGRLVNAERVLKMRGAEWDAFDSIQTQPEMIFENQWIVSF